MAKQIIIPYNGKEYTLEYTRKTVEQMERAGFIADEVRTKPMTTFPVLFAGAFKAHHKNIKPELTREIYDTLGNREELIGKLAEMYAEPLNALLSDPPESEGNATWTASW